MDTMNSPLPSASNGPADPMPIFPACMGDLALDERILRRVCGSDSMADALTTVLAQLAPTIPHRCAWLADVDLDASELVPFATIAGRSGTIAPPDHLPFGAPFAEHALTRRGGWYVRGRRRAADPFDAALEQMGAPSHITFAVPSSSSLRVMSLAAPPGATYSPGQLHAARRAQPLLAAALSLHSCHTQPLPSYPWAGFDPVETVEYMCRALSHDIRNIMAGVLGAIELNPRLESDDSPLVDAVRRRALDAVAMVGAMDRAMRLSPSPQSEAVELSALCCELAATVRAILAARIPRTLRPTVRCEGLPTWAVGDPKEVRRALVALLFNAARSASSGGEVVLRCSPGQHAALLEVLDTGAGMTDDSLRRAKEPFYTTLHGNHLGLGLTIADGVARRYGGGLAVRHGAGGGTRVAMTLPLAHRETVARY